MKSGHESTPLYRYQPRRCSFRSACRSIRFMLIPYGRRLGVKEHVDIAMTGHLSRRYCRRLRPRSAACRLPFVPRRVHSPSPLPLITTFGTSFAWLRLMAPAFLSADTPQRRHDATRRRYFMPGRELRFDVATPFLCS